MKRIDVDITEETVEQAIEQAQAEPIFLEKDGKDVAVIYSVEAYIKQEEVRLEIIKSMLENKEEKMNMDRLNNVDLNKSAYIKKSSSRTLAVRGVSIPPSYRLVMFEGDDGSFEIALLCDVSKEVVYCIKCIPLSEFQLVNSIVRVLVWRTLDIAHFRVMSGLPEKLFENYLLDRYIISFKIKDSVDFWLRQIGYAMRNLNYVYMVDNNTHKLSEICSHAKVRNNSKMWLSDILISKSSPY